MILEARQHKRGFSIKIEDKNRTYRQILPERTWQNFPYKDFLVNELAFLATLPLPIVARRRNISYNTAEPFFFGKFRQLFIEDIPTSNEDYKASTDLIVKKAMEINYSFNKDDRNKLPETWQDTEETAVLPFSFGKDSSLTFALARELGLNPLPIYINDTVSRKENSLKLAQVGNFKPSRVFVVRNEIENLNDFELWDKPATCLSYTHMTTSFCFVALPLVWQEKARYILPGNEQDMDFSFRGKEGHTCFPSYDQTSTWQNEQNKMISTVTHNKVHVSSLIRPLTNMAIVKILHRRYPDIARYEISCDCLNINNEKRWCQSCNKCARLYILMLANKINPAGVGFTKDMLQRKYEKYYSLFSKSKTEIDRYEKSREAREQQLLAFYIAYKNKARGELVDLFKKRFLKEAVAREDELIKKFFKIYPAEMPLPPEKRNQLMSIFKEELSEFR